VELLLMFCKCLMIDEAEERAECFEH